MATKKLRSIKGRVARITRLDQCGAPVFGTCGFVVTEGFISVTYSREEEAGDEYLQKNAWGTFCINEKDPDLTKWWNVSIVFCEVDPDVLDIIGGATPVVFGSDTIGATFGPNAPVGKFGLEVWTKAVGQGACAGGLPEWGYFLLAEVRNGKVDGDITIENAALTLTLTGEGVSASDAWGTGPHGDNPMKVVSGFPAGDQLAIVKTDVQPPAPTDGCQPLVAPPDPGDVEPGDVFPANPSVTAEDGTNAAALIGLGYVVSPGSVAAWDEGEFFTIGTFHFYWDGDSWEPGEAPA